ncbi:phage tail protein [Stutzerimonas chloritidismutans]|uniref:phage tail protein n=1 Tax=Stutzerimonas chloritidismutans TaxID=203192 RepID=UPI0028A6E69C|nr:phage tail protein [Stutzerimonas chloritidismutans]
MADQNSQYMAMLTAVGEAKLANATALGVNLNITQLGVGDANGAEPMPSRTQTALINERRRAPLNQLSIDPNNSAIIIAEQVIPEDIGGWWIREIGLYDEAGDLIAVANCPPTFKPELAQGSGRTQVVRLNILVSSTQSIQLKIDPSVVLATRAYADALIVGHLAAEDPHPQYQLRGPVTTLSANTAITTGQLGLLLLDAAGGNRSFTLPAANAALGVREVTLRRIDATANALVIAASGTDKIMLDTTAEAAGQTTTELLFAGDFLRLRSDSAGKWWCVGQAQLPGSIASGLFIYSDSGVHTFIVPAVLRSGRRRSKVTVVGGGGPGGGAAQVSAGQVAQGAGGGAGGAAIKLVDLQGVSTVDVVVAGVTTGPVGVNVGTDGGTSSFGTFCSATGGKPGGSGSATAGSGSGYGGAGGVGVGGDINLAGGQGGTARLYGGYSFGANFGGDSLLGMGGAATRSASDGISGVGAGAGGSGANSEDNTNRRGGSGSKGFVMIEF